MRDALEVASWVAAVLAVAGAFLWWLSRRPLWRGVHDFLADWQGEAPRPGFDGRPGVMLRLARIERRLDDLGGTPSAAPPSPNGRTPGPGPVSSPAATADLGPAST